jgi:alpha/beta superfamily hydrolase
MQQRNVIHEQIRFGKDDYLSGVLSYPADGNPTLAVLVCSPHPNFGGDMENNVVAAVAERLSSEAVTLRFDYRGVGKSRIDLPPGLSVFDYWENVEQTLDYAEPFADTLAAADELSSLSDRLPIIAVGYSFGAIMGTTVGVRDPRIVVMAGISPPLKRVAFEHLFDCPKPCLLVSGQDDFVYDIEVAQRLIQGAGSKLVFDRPAADHFFVGLEADLAERIASFVSRASFPVRMAVVDGAK